MDTWIWLTAEHERPHKRFASVPASRPQPLHKRTPPVKILPNLTGLRSDDQYLQFLERNKDQTVREPRVERPPLHCRLFGLARRSATCRAVQVVVNFGSSWCEHCHQMLPHYLNLAAVFPRLKYAVAQVDYMEEAARGITYTPTFAIIKKGRRVDSFYGSNEQQLRDHLWLHS